MAPETDTNKIIKENSKVTTENTKSLQSVINTLNSSNEEQSKEKSETRKVARTNFKRDEKGRFVSEKRMSSINDSLLSGIGGFSTKMSAFSSSIMASTEGFRESFKGGFGKLVDKFKGIGATLKKSLPSLEDVKEKKMQDLKLMESLSNLGKSMGKLVKSGFGKGIDKVFKAFKGLFKLIPGLAIALFTFSTDFRNLVFDKIIAPLMDFGIFIGGFFMKEIFAPGKKLFNTLLANFKDGFSIEAVTKSLGDIGKFVLDMGDLLINVLGKGLNFVFSKLGFDELGAKIENMLTTFDLKATVLGFIDDIKMVGGFIGQQLGLTWDWILGLFDVSTSGELLAKAVGGVTNIASWISDKVGIIWKGILGFFGVEDGAGLLSGAIGEFANIKDFIVKQALAIFDNFKAIFSIATDADLSGGEKVITIIGKLFDNMWLAVKSVFGIAELTVGKLVEQATGNNPYTIVGEFFSNIGDFLTKLFSDIISSDIVQTLAGYMNLTLPDLRTGAEKEIDVINAQIKQKQEEIALNKKIANDDGFIGIGGESEKKRAQATKFAPQLEQQLIELTAKKQRVVGGQDKALERMEKASERTSAVSLTANQVNKQDIQLAKDVLPPVNIQGGNTNIDSSTNVAPSSQTFQSGAGGSTNDVVRELEG